MHLILEKKKPWFEIDSPDSKGDIYQKMYKEVMYNCLDLVINV